MNSIDDIHIFHILIIRFSSLGDVVLTTSLPSFLKRQWGRKIFISYLTSSQFLPLLEGHPHLDQVLAINRERGIGNLQNLRRFIQEIRRKRKIDLIIDMHGTLRSLFIRLIFPTIPRIWVDKRTLERWLLTGLKIDLLSFQGDRKKERRKGFGELLLLRTVRDFAPFFNLSLKSELTSPELSESENQVSSCAMTFQGKNQAHLPWEKWNLQGVQNFSEGRYICFIPSASFPEKRWPPQKFKKLLEMALTHPDFEEEAFVILAGPQDDFCQVFNELQQKFPHRFFNLQGQTNLVESTLFLKQAKFCVGNDTGLPHLSEAVGVPAIFILGPTGEEFGFYPHLKSSKVVSMSLWCRPCTTNGKGHCIRSERFCLTLINEERVFQEMIELHQERGKRAWA